MTDFNSQWLTYRAMGILLSEAVLTLANCAGFTLCKKTRFPWKRHVISYERPCSGEEIINSTVSPVFLEESFVQLRNNYMTSLYELSWQIQNLTLFAIERMPVQTSFEKSRIITKVGQRCPSSSILLDLFEKLSEIGLYMSLIQEHFSVFMDFNWLEDHLLRVMCNLRKIYHRHGQSDHRSNTLLQSATKYSLCIKHNTNCANFYVWLLDKLQTVNNKMDRVVTSSRRFELQGQYHV
eukprot:XP_019930872.1 PREDICTED: uncharacterized protein LOC105348283 [Crassostrea gigas]